MATRSTSNPFKQGETPNSGTDKHTSFHLFPKLPFELQLRVWELAAAAPQATLLAFAEGETPSRIRYPYGPKKFLDPAPGPFISPRRQGMYWIKPSERKRWLSNQTEETRTQRVIIKSPSLLMCCVDSREGALKERGAHLLKLTYPRGLYDRGIDSENEDERYLRGNPYWFLFDRRKDALLADNILILEELCYRHYYAPEEILEGPKLRLRQDILILAIRDLSLHMWDHFKAHTENKGKCVHCQSRSLVFYLERQFPYLEQLILVAPKVMGFRRFLGNGTIDENYFVEEDWRPEPEEAKRRVDEFIEENFERVEKSNNPTHASIPRHAGSDREYGFWQKMFWTSPTVTIMTQEEFRDRFSF